MFEQAKFPYSPLGKVFNDGLNKKDKKEKKVGVSQLLKNIADNLSGSDGDGNGNGNIKVGLFKIVKDIKNKGIKISYGNKAIKEISKHIQELRNKGVKVSNFNKMTKELKEYTDSLNIEMSDKQIKDFVGE